MATVSRSSQDSLTLVASTILELILHQASSILHKASSILHLVSRTCNSHILVNSRMYHPARTPCTTRGHLSQVNTCSKATQLLVVFSPCHLKVHLRDSSSSG